MDRSKIGVVAGIFVFLVIIIWALVAIAGRQNPNEVAMKEALILQNTVNEISDIALARSGNLQTQTTASTVLSTTTSDRNRISALYSNLYGSPPSDFEAEAIEEIEVATENFDAVYRSLTSEYLQLSLDRLLLLRDSLSDDEVQETLHIAIENHQIHLQSLSDQ